MKNLELDYEAVKKFQFYIQKMNAALDIDGVTPFITEKKLYRNHNTQNKWHEPMISMKTF